jgi:hypothetical protein
MVLDKKNFGKVIDFAKTLFLKSYEQKRGEKCISCS